MTKEKKQLFRQKSLEQISSPEELNRYIKSTSPSLWILLIAIIILLLGTIAWSVTGKIESSIAVGLSTDGTYGKLLVRESDGEKITEDSFVRIDETEYEIVSISNLTNSDGNETDYLLYKAGLNADDWYYVVTVQCNLEAGDYNGKLIFEVINPITFVLN